MKQAGFILEVLFISTGLSILIKYGGPTLSITPTPINALIVVLVPTLVMVIALLFRWRRT